MPRREYKGAAGPLQLSATILAGTLTWNVTGDTTGWPTGAGGAKFCVEIDRGVDGKAEKVWVTTRAGSAFTVGGAGDRGADGTTAVGHGSGAWIEHVVDAGSIDEANDHVNNDSRDDHSQYLNVERHDEEARHLLGTSVPTGVPTDLDFGDSASEGVSTSAARADHEHGMPHLGVVGSVSSSSPGDTALAGTSGKAADANHRHAREAWGVVGDISSSSPGQAAAAGGTGRTADAGHRHAREASANLVMHTTGTDGDQGVSPGGEITMASQSINLTGTRLIDIDGSFDVRSASADPTFAGYLNLKIDGVTVRQKRWDSHGLGGNLFPTLSWEASLAAGAHTILLTCTNDVSSVPTVICSSRVLLVAEIGG